MHIALNLSREEQQEAAALLEEYGGYVNALAFKHSGDLAEFDDLAQVARLAVLKAVRDHDPERPGACSRDALVWRYIQTAIWRQIRDHNGLVRVPAGKARTGRTFTRSLDAPVSSETPLTLEELLPAPEAEMGMGDDEKAVLWQALARLPERERDIIDQVYFRKVNLCELAKQRGYSRQYLDQIRVKGLNRLRGFAAVQGLKMEGGMA